MKAVIQFDGGCVPNPGKKYGSFSISLESFYIERRRFDLGHGTNNEAEFEALEAALKELAEASAKARVNPKFITVHVITDSTIVSNWLEVFRAFKPERCKNARRVAMSEYAGRCVALLDYFQRFSVEWQGRDANVAKFGH